MEAIEAYQDVFLDDSHPANIRKVYQFSSEKGLSRHRDPAVLVTAFDFAYAWTVNKNRQVLSFW